ncbi:MAG: 50S ribosomal protein L4 [Parcubacteria group bacterium GW2011_GWB1_46_8]|nr:MAG: 50S ribosomal protein L4 [Parcubacteria group bacterium GW2011_GWA2_46_7]KKU46674.1 MAG: 50S ribosomal protein L4 [Parcubacteria group bacterium GW2011_GWB1_46_8]KKU47148.1 MAG: 50S ribosomal protein L4 [Parcubacteria group bacterium GW2011_GWF2_46_8]
MDVAVYNKKKEQIRTVSLDESVFGITVNPDVVHEVVRVLRGNVRKPIAHAKDRGAVSGGGKKPWRQKGTGRARHGSIRSPLWRKGGVTHGPLNERVFARSLNKKTKWTALAMVLSGKVKRNLFCVVSDDVVADFSKTKLVQPFVDSFLKEGKRIHRGFLLHSFSDTSSIRGVRNIQQLRWAPVSGINIMDCVNAMYVIVPESSLQALTSFMKRL